METTKRRAENLHLLMRTVTLKSLDTVENTGFPYYEPHQSPRAILPPFSLSAVFLTRHEFPPNYILSRLRGANLARTSRSTHKDNAEVTENGTRLFENILELRGQTFGPVPSATLTKDEDGNVRFDRSSTDKDDLRRDCRVHRCGRAFL